MDLTVFAGGQGLVVGVANFQGIAHGGKPYRSRPCGEFRPPDAGPHAAGFREAVAQAQIGRCVGEGLLHSALKIGAGGRPPEADIAKTRQIEPFPGRVVDHQRARTAQSAPDGDVFLFHDAHDVLGVEARVAVDGFGALAQHHDDRRVEAGQVKQGNGDQADRRGRGFRALGGRLRARGDHETLESVEGLGLGKPDQGAVADHCALGAAGGSAGVQDQTRVVFGDGRVGQWRARGAFHQGGELAFDLQGGNVEFEIADSRQALAVADQELGFAVARGIADFIGGPKTVEGHQDAAQAGHGPPGDHPLGPVGGEQRDSVALFDSVIFRKCSGGGSHPLKVIRVADSKLTLDDVLLVAVEPGFSQQVAHRPRASLKDLHGFAVNIFFAKFEGATRANELLSNF